ncbi:MAG: PEP-utilizing enzyme [Verrucomicrobiota bacterium]
MSLQSHWPSVYRDLVQVGEIAEHHLRDVADIEFTIVNGVLFVDSVRPAFISFQASIRTRLQLLTEGIITPEEFLERTRCVEVAALLRPEITDKTNLTLLGTGVAGSGGAISGKVVFATTSPARLKASRFPKILVVDYYHHKVHEQVSRACAGVLELAGNFASHGALRCQADGTPCVAGWRNATFEVEERRLRIRGFEPVHEGDWLTIDGMTGEVYAGRARIETKPWQSHAELRSLWLIIESAVATGHVPTSCAGTVWQIWDFMRHGMPLPGWVTPPRRTKACRRWHTCSGEHAAIAARRKLNPIAETAQVNHGKIICGLVRTIERLVYSTGRGKRKSICRALWDPTHQLCLEKCSQLVGFEFTGINLRLHHLPEISDIRFLIECAVQSPSEAWTIALAPGFGLRVRLGTQRVQASRITVNGAELAHEDLPAFYTWLRRREYFWQDNC